MYGKNEIHIILHRITKSLNPLTGEPRSLEPVAQVHVLMDFEYVHGGILQNPSEESVVVLSHPYSKKGFLMF